MGACLCKTRQGGLNGDDSDTEDLGDPFNEVRSSRHSARSPLYAGSTASNSSNSTSNSTTRAHHNHYAQHLLMLGSHSDLTLCLNSCQGHPSNSTNSNSNSNTSKHRSGRRTNHNNATSIRNNSEPSGNVSGDQDRIWSLQNKLSLHADRLVVDTLDSIQPTVLSESSNSMQKLHLIAETEIGWLVVINSLINKVNLEHPFGSALILLILEDAPLPSRKSICQLDQVLGLQMERERSIARQRNISIVLGCLAEKLAGSLSAVLFTQTIQDFLLSRIEPNTNDLNVILYSLIALEKFSQTIDNKRSILQALKQMGHNNPLLKLEQLAINNRNQKVQLQKQQQQQIKSSLIQDTNNKDKLLSSALATAMTFCNQSNGTQFSQQKDYFLQLQVSFCASWHLDNYFTIDGRAYTYEQIDRENLNAILNIKDSSENLKISPDGLTARNDTSRFESVRCTYAMTSGIYYYEAELITAGVMQIGLATKQSRFLNYEGFGIGDDDHSLAYDGCRQLIWQNAKSGHTKLNRWKEGDIVGCLIDLQQFEVRFSLNGQMGEPNGELFKNKSLSTQYYAAASFMPFQHCVFNFGRTPFKYPPIEYNFKAFNQCASLTDEEKVIMPKHVLLTKRGPYSSDPMLNLCTICCDNVAKISLQPCEHR